MTGEDDKNRKEEEKEMKLIKLVLVIMAVAVMTLVLGGNALAFHEEGVAYCAGCHTMHNSQDGQAIVESGQGGYLLRQVDGGSTCLRCHAEYGQRTQTGSGYGGGGDFYWLTKTFTWSAHGHEAESTGDSHGHNIIAADFGLVKTDGKLGTKAPGGDYNHELSCASCHDPHGNENYLLLRGNGDTFHGADFPDAPIAVSPGRVTNYLSTSNSKAPVSDTLHPAYGSGMSAWCAGCHTDFINGIGSRMHPADVEMNSTYQTNYNYYVSSSNPQGGNPNAAYLEMVPFQTGDTTTDSLDTKSTAGPGAGAQVFCLSCHRAHASAFPDAGRWFFESENLSEESHPMAGDGGVTGDDVINSYYGQSITSRFGENQRSLCNKCHLKDLQGGAHG
jgi:hypothetical protein